LGRFISPDTFIQAPYNPQSLNRYSYCLNNPLKYIDPTGNFAFLAALIVIAKAAIVGAAIGAAVGATLGGINAAINGTSIWTGIGMGLCSGAISGAAAGAGFGAGAVGVGGLFGAKAMSFWGTKVALGALSGSMGGMANAAYSGTSIAQGAMWGAATGTVFTGVAISPVGRALGRGIGNTGVGRILNKANKWVGSSYDDFIAEVHGGSAGSALNANKSSTVSNGQALSDRGSATGVAEQPDKLVIKYQDAAAYRQGTFANEEVGWKGNFIKGREWAPENPLTTPNYAQKYGLPAQNSGKPDWVTTGRIRGEYGVQSAPASYNNPSNTGGADQIIPSNADDVLLDSFYMPD